MFGSKKYRWSDYRLDSAGPSGPSGLWIQQGKARLPASVDLRPGFGPVLDQGWLPDGSVAFALTGLAEFIFRQQPHKGAWSPLSVLHQHQRTTALAQRLGKGAPTILDGMTVLLSFGALRESDWPSMPERIGTQPPATVSRANIEFVTTDLSDVWAGPDGVYRTIAEGRPVVFSYVGPADYLKEAGLKGAMPKWKGKVDTASDPAGHAMLAVGYDMADGALIVRNSFGADWGDQGYFRMPIETFRAHAAGLMALGPVEAGRSTKLMGEAYPGEKAQDAGHRKFMDVLMGESYPGEKDQDAGHRKFMDALMGSDERDAGHRKVIDMIWGGGSTMGNDERDAGHRKVIDMIWGGYPGSAEQDRAHQTFVSALMGGRFAPDANSEVGARACAATMKQAGLPAYQGSGVGEMRRGAEMGVRTGTADTDGLDRLARDVRQDLSDASDEAGRDFRNRLRRQEDEVMRGPRGGGGRGQGGGGQGGDDQGGRF